MKRKILLFSLLTLILPLAATARQALASPGCVVTFHVKAWYTHLPLEDAKVEIRNYTTNDLITYKYTDFWGRASFDLEFWTTYKYVVIKSPYATESGWFNIYGSDTHDETVYMMLQYPLSGVGGMVAPVNKLGLLTPQITLASIMLVTTVAITVCVKRVKHRDDSENE